MALMRDFLSTASRLFGPAGSGDDAADPADQRASMRTAAGGAGRHGDDDDCWHDGGSFVRGRAFEPCEERCGLIAVRSGRDGDIQEIRRVNGHGIEQRKDAGAAGRAIDVVSEGGIADGRGACGPRQANVVLSLSRHRSEPKCKHKRGKSWNRFFHRVLPHGVAVIC